MPKDSRRKVWRDPAENTSKSTAVSGAGGDDGEKREGGVGGDEEAGEQEGEAHQPAMETGNRSGCGGQEA
jgi:hypothetical protein